MGGGRLKYLVFILAIWRRHSLGVEENSCKKRMSHLGGHTQLVKLWEQLLAASDFGRPVLTAAESPCLGWDTPMYCGCRDSDCKAS